MRAKIALISRTRQLPGAVGPWRGHGRRRPGGRKRAGRTARRDDHDRDPLAAGPGLRQRARRRRRRPDRPRRPRLHLADRHQRGHRAERGQPRDAAARTGSARPRRPSGEAASSRAATIDGGEAGDASGGVTHNESLGDSSGGGGSGGGVSAPSATGGGDQPLAEGSDGGSQFGAGGAPTAANPTTTIAPFGPAPIGVPNFVIDSFEIPPFLLPIYQACGTEYGIPWEVLASINKIETGFGTNLNVSSAGAVGWMQFLPSSWETYGRRRQRRRAQRPLQPGRRDLRRRQLPEGRRRQQGPLRRDLRLQPRRLVRAGGAALRPRLRQAARPTWSAR